MPPEIPCRGATINKGATLFKYQEGFQSIEKDGYTLSPIGLQIDIVGATLFLLTFIPQEGF